MKRILKLLINRVVIVAVLLLLQLAWFLGFFYRLARYFVAVDIVLTILALLVVLTMAARQENPAYKLSWTILIMAVPVFGILFYLCFGNVTAGKTALLKRGIRQHERMRPFLTGEDEERRKLTEEEAGFGRQSRYLSFQDWPAYKNTETEYLPIGEVYFERLLEELKKAEHFIFLEYFIIEKSFMWDQVLEVLKEKTREGVEVRLIYDDFGCLFLLPFRYEKELSSYGIETRVFNPFIPLLSIVMNNRDHRKIVVIDGHTGFTGGINLGDEYINKRKVHGHWKDTGIMLKGEGVWSLTAMFLEMWNTIQETDRDFSPYYPEVWHEEAFSGKGFVQPYCDSPMDKENVGENVYLNIIGSARRYVYIYTPYLIIDNEMMTALTLAAKSGVDVRIVTPHIPDKKMVFMLTQSYYGQLIRAGVKIYEYTPGFIHAKCFLSDDVVGTVGTINLDFRSLYLHFECGTLLYRTDSLEAMKRDFQETFEKSQLITQEFVNSISVPKRAFQAVLRLMAPLL